MKIIFLHPTGNSNVRAVTKALAQASLLEKFFTCVAVFKNSAFYNLSKFKPLREFRRRSFAPILRSYTYTRPFRELGRLASEKFGWENGVVHEQGIFCIDKIYLDLDLYVSKRIKNVCAVYAYEDGALKSFQEAKIKGLKCLYDLPTGYWRAHRKFLDKERERRPDWAMTLNCFQDSETKLLRKDEELKLADAIFLASSFTKKTLELFPGKLGPIYLVPYGFPEVYKSRKYNSISGRKLRLLFVGGLSQRKGIADLFEAVDSLKERVELTVVGQEVTKGCKPLQEGLKRHTWIPSLPHNQILELMHAHDLFVFPSLFEGYGLVIAEAMSQGTPVITTSRTCGADFIIDNVNGWIVPAGNTDALIKKIADILVHPDCLERVGKAAMETAKEFPMTKYGEKMVDTIKQILKLKDLARKN